MPGRILGQQLKRCYRTLICRFRNGSIYEDATVFSQQLDTLVDASTGQVTARYTESNGMAIESASQMGLPPELANPPAVSAISARLCRAGLLI